MRAIRNASVCLNVPLCLMILSLLWLAAMPAAAQNPATCTTGKLDPSLADGTRDLVVNTGPTCTVAKGTYKYKSVNIYGGGTLNFNDEVIDFYASSILVENNGSLVAGTRVSPIGTKGGKLTIHIYGAADKGTPPHNKGITCKTGVQCGVPDALWQSNASSPSPCVKASAVAGVGSLPGKVDDCFYPYSAIDYDDGDPNGYFGTKVLGVGYGGTLQLFGQKGAQYPTAVALPAWNSGTSWARLSQNVAGGTSGSTIVLDRAVPYWAVNDHIVVTSTDYLPGHAEEMVITAKQADNKTLTVERADSPGSGFQYVHNDKQYDISGLPAGVGPDPDPNLPANKGKVETRAAVGLLTRSIRIVSEGDTVDQAFKDAGATYSFGAHTMFRQGFKAVQLQGVEFYQMGQGGEMMHYPVHFHMARKTPQPTAPTDPTTGTYVKDCSVRESMTRWITLHSTQGVTLARNVGYLSIGHGFYLEDGTETDNKFYSNLGVFARASVDNAQNPRKIAGILSAPDVAQLPPGTQYTRYTSDVEHPSVFWIPNGWNDFQYNVAAGAGSCGMCYWLVPMEVSGHSQHQSWSGYAAEQFNPNTGPGSAGLRAGITPLQNFVGNSCSAAMNSLITVGDTAACTGVERSAGGDPYVPSVPNSLAPAMSDPAAEMYYPRVNALAGRRPTQCPAGQDCANIVPCSDGHAANCVVTVINRYTTSFNWAQTNVSAIWLRPQWYLFLNGAITDVQNGGLTFVTGGDYTHSSIIKGYWALARKNVFIGETQAGNPYASSAGPVAPTSEGGKLQCARRGDGAPVGGFCLLASDGVSFPTDGFALNQRFFNIYDGPSYQSSNGYLSITPKTLTGCVNGTQCAQNGWLYGMQPGMPKDPTASSDNQACYLPNAAIGWKQPNTFYYPPAFHSENLFFQDVPIRHFVVEPQFLQGSYNINPNSKYNYCSWSPGMYLAFTDTDRQTELTDDDGTLTGLTSGAAAPFGPTISVNMDDFFNAPRDTRECGSDVHTAPGDPLKPPVGVAGTARTSPYQYVTSVVYPDCIGRRDPKCLDKEVWGLDCESRNCPGVPLYRMLQSQDDIDKGLTTPPFIRMAGTGIGQRSTLTVNHGTYYVDNTVSQNKFGYGQSSLFLANETYNMFFLYATPEMSQTYQFYVDSLGQSEQPEVHRVRVDISGDPLKTSPDGDGVWPSSKMSYDPSTKILSVTVDKDAFTNFVSDYNAARKAQCQPSTFCTWNSAGQGSCGCALKTTDPLYGECQNSCRYWAGRDIDCPEGGCYGLAVKMPSGFVAKDQGSNVQWPTPSCPKPTDAGWSTAFSTTTKAKQPDDCAYTTIPADKFCTK